MKRIRLSDGTTMDYPDAEDVQRFLGALGPRLDFAVLTDTHRGFVQVMWGPSMDEAEGTLVLETKGPHVDGHVRAVVREAATVEDAFLGFLDDDVSWVEARTWEPVEPN